MEKDRRTSLDVGPIVEAYEAAIAAQLSDRGDRRRFVKVRALCKQVDDLLRLGAEDLGRVGLLGDDECDEGGGMIGGRVMGIGGLGPETLVRELVASAGPLIGECSRRTKAEAERAAAATLESLVKARSAMVKAKVSTAGIDAKINRLREEICNGDDLVRPVVLRGREDGANGGEEDDGQVGEAHGGGAGGPREVGRGGR